MAANEAVSTIKINVETAQAIKDLKKFKTSINSIISALGIRELYKFTESLAKAGMEGLQAEKAFRNFVPSVKDATRKLSEASLGMIEQTVLQQKAVQAMISGIKFDDYIIALEYASKFAVSTGKDTEEVLSTITNAFLTGRANSLRRSGIEVSSGKDMIVNALSQMKSKMKEFDTAIDDPVVKLNRMKAEMQDIQDEAGRNFIPVLIEINRLFLFIAKSANNALNDFMKQTNLERMAIQIEKIDKISSMVGADRLLNTRVLIEESKKLEDKEAAILNLKNNQIDIIKSIGDASEEARFKENPNTFKASNKEREKQLGEVRNRLLALTIAAKETGDALNAIMNRPNKKLFSADSNGMTAAETKKIQDEKLKKYNDYIDAMQAMLDSEQVIKDENEEKEKKRLEGIKNAQDLVNAHYQKIADDKNETDAKRLEALKKLAEYQLFLSGQTITAQEKEFEIRKKGFDDIGNLADNTFSVMSEFSNRHIRNELNNLDRKKLGEKKYNKEREKILKEQGEQEKNLARLEQGIVLAKTLMHIAEGQGKATAKGFLGIPEWFFVAAQGVAEIAMIQAQKFQRGYLGEVDRSRRPDNINAVIGRNEAVIPGPQYAMHEEDIKAIVSNTANTAAGMRGLRGGSIVHQYYGLSAEQVISVQRDAERRKYAGSLI